MKIYRRIEDRLELGEDDVPESARLRVELSRLEESQVWSASFRFVATDDTKWYTFDGEVIERIAKALQLRRRKDHDYREVCADHGYHAVAYAKGSTETCPKCEDARLARDAQARLEGASQP